MTPEKLPKNLDVAVIGGGLAGVGVARDCALRGMSCALFEMGDFAQGASSRMTRLLHGGLRYVYRGDLPFALECLQERQRIDETAHHLVDQIPLLIPVYKGDGKSRARVRTGLSLYHLCTKGMGTPMYGMLSPEETAKKSPFLAIEDLKGAGVLYDYILTRPERLVLENVLSAENNGAICLNYTEVVNLKPEGEGYQLTVRSVLDGDEQTVASRFVVNTGGAWADGPRETILPAERPLVSQRKAPVIALDMSLDTGVFRQSRRRDIRVVALPMGEITLIRGPETSHEGSIKNVKPERKEIEKLFEMAQNLFPGRGLKHSDVVWADLEFRGHPKGLKSGILSHPMDIKIWREGEKGRFVTALGGAVATYRRSAQKITDLVAEELGNDAPCSTSTHPLFGSGVKDSVIYREDLYECYCSQEPISRERVEFLIGLYGKKTCDVMDIIGAEPKLGASLSEESPCFGAQVAYAVRREKARRLPDVILRRLCRGYTVDRGATEARSVAQIMATELGWSSARTEEEVSSFVDSLNLGPLDD